MINRTFFFDQARKTLFDGKLKQSQVDGLSAILDTWEDGYAKKDDRWLAYMLATAHHETDRTMQPIREYGRGKNRKYGIPDPDTGQVYYGRGFVQLTWRANYEAMSKLVKDDLVADADLALRPDYASIIMFEGMIRGSFTGRKLATYFNPEKEDWGNARRIINGTDKANTIASYGKGYYAAISYTT
ncbi:MAG: glycoside hydrolase family 19 protein [Dongiaceae bacterium]